MIRWSRPMLLGVGVGLAFVGWRRPWRRHIQPSRMLDEFVPGAQFRDTIAVDVAAPPQRVFQALQEVTLRDMPVAWAVGELRYLPGRLTGHASSAPAGPGGPVGDRPFLSLILNEGGSIVLAEHADEEVVIGSIGRLHDPLDQALVPLDGPAAFRAFAEPGFEKLAMSMRAQPIGAHRTTAVLEHRTLALDGGARRRFSRYWLAIKPGGAFVSWLLLRAARRRAEASDPPAATGPCERDRSTIGAGLR